MTSRFARAATALVVSLLTGAALAAPPVLDPALDGSSGQRAIDLLGPRLDAVAASHRRSADEFRAMLRRDPLLRLDRRGRVYAVDILEHPLPPAPEIGPAFADAAPPAPLGKTFRLHSRPGAQRTIFLDFDGAVIENTAWNGGGGSIIALPFDSDGQVDTNFSDAELKRIQFIWQRVAEDYAPFDIDVTTEQPAQGKITRKNGTDEVYGTVVLITDHDGVYDCQCGGVAYVGVFDALGDFYKPALVFWDMLGSGNEKYVAEAISHEAGHNLGLNHDGYAGGGYYPGHGEGDTGWAPIMGVGYYQPVVQWSRGEYDTANNHEDDFVVIGLNGGPLRPDDHGNAAGGATPLTATPSGPDLILSGAGVVERRKDKDYFSFEAGAGNARFTVSPDARSPNLDVLLKVFDAAGNQIGKANPKAVLGASVELSLPSAGTYYLMVDGVGVGNPLNTGYSDYASLGQYSITGTVPAP